jgi:hypothetical protein
MEDTAASVEAVAPPSTDHELINGVKIWMFGSMLMLLSAA